MEENAQKQAASGTNDGFGVSPGGGQQNWSTPQPGRVIRARTRTDPLPKPRSDGHSADHTRPRGLSLLSDGLQQLAAVHFSSGRNGSNSRTIRPASPAVHGGETTPTAPTMTVGSGVGGTPPLSAPRGKQDTSLTAGAVTRAQHHECRANAAAATNAATSEALRGGSGDRPRTASRPTTIAHAEISSPLPEGGRGTSTNSSAPPGPSGPRHHPTRPAPSTSDSAHINLSSNNIANTAHQAQERLRYWSHRRSLHTPEAANPPRADPAHSSCHKSRTPVPGSTQPIPIPRRHRPSPLTPLTGRFRPSFDVESHFPSEDVFSEGSGSTTYSQDPTGASFREGTSPAASPFSPSGRASSDALIFESNSLLDQFATQTHFRSPQGRNASGLSPLREPKHTKHHRRAWTAPNIRVYQVMNRSELSAQLSPRRRNPQSAYDMSGHRKPGAVNLQMPALPRFHPAVYQSPNASANGSPTGHRNPHGRSTSGSQRSGPQQQLYQYQRELLASVSRTTSSASQPYTPHDTPKAPSLHPCGSPGPPTPLALEDGADYLTAGAAAGSNSRELVDQLIREEHERRNGMGAGRSSPAVSPAGGRG